jgi:hypothetical protein
MARTRDSVDDPPGPLAVMVIVARPEESGVPVISPVAESMEAQLGSPIALHDVAGRFSGSVRAGEALKATPN